MGGRETAVDACHGQRRELGNTVSDYMETFGDQVKIINGGLSTHGGVDAVVEIKNSNLLLRKLYLDHLDCCTVEGQRIMCMPRNVMCLFPEQVKMASVMILGFLSSEMWLVCKSYRNHTNSDLIWRNLQLS